MRTDKTDRRTATRWSSHLQARVPLTRCSRLVWQGQDPPATYVLLHLNVPCGGGGTPAPGRIRPVGSRKAERNPCRGLLAITAVPSLLLPHPRHAWSRQVWPLPSLAEPYQRNPKRVSGKGLPVVSVAREPILANSATSCKPFCAPVRLCRGGAGRTHSAGGIEPEH